MYNTLNKDSIYYLFDRNTGKTTKIGDYQDLIKKISLLVLGEEYTPLWLHIRRGRGVLWTENDFDRMMLGVNLVHPKRIFNEQNLTGKDIEVVHDFGNDVTYCGLKQYTFFTGAGRIIDINNLRDDVKRVLVTGQSFGEPDWHLFICTRYPVSHTTYGCKRGLHKREIQSKDKCEEQGVKYRTKALPFYGTDSWEGYRRSAGWKSHKYKKQYMHNLDNKKHSSDSARSYWKNTTYVEDVAETA